MPSELDSLETENEEEQVGINLFKKALKEPFRAIAKNSGIYDISILVDKIEKHSKAGYNFKTLQEVDDMIKAGIIDPTLVLKQAIANASSIAGSVITTEVVMVEEPKNETPSSAGMGGGMSMM